jgi:hypothetical protein
MVNRVRIHDQINICKHGLLCKWIHDVFADDSKTILWIIGDIMADFGTKRMFILYGPGNIGKTTVVSIIRSLSSNTINDIGGSFMAKRPDVARHFGNIVMDIYMELPQGIQTTNGNSKDHVLKLEKNISFGHGRLKFPSKNDDF